MSADDAASTAESLVRAMSGQGLTLAVAESLTGGLLSATIVDVPGASAVLRGGIVAYATELKHELLGVDAALLAEHGPIHPQVATMMAAGVRERCGADVGVATTGVAGPDSQDGHLPGEVFIAVVTAADVEVRGLHLTGDREHVRAKTVAAALALVTETIELAPAETTSEESRVEPE